MDRSRGSHERGRKDGEVFEMSVRADSALLLIDLITDFEFEDGDKLFTATNRILNNLRSLRDRCYEAGSPIIYVNDPPKNGSDSVSSLLDGVGRTERGRFMLEQIGPTDSSFVIFKPQRSGFFDTALEDALHRVGAKHIYIAGITTDICVLFTAHDAYMRKFKVSVPANCATAVKPEYHEEALRFLERVAEADISPEVFEK